MSDIADLENTTTVGEKDVAMEDGNAEAGEEVKEKEMPAVNGAAFGSHMGEPQRDANGKLIVPEGMTKNQYKKLLKEQQWEAGREARQAMRKEKNKELRQRKRLQTREKRKATEDAGQPEQKKVRVQEDITFVLDCAFDDLMIDKEINSLSSQIVRCHSANRASTHRCKMKLTSYSGRLQKRMDIALQAQHQNWHNFEVTTEPYPITDSTIYLTAESDTTLETLDPGMTYIIGGIVDKNRHKGLCHKKATGQGLKTAKLPIGEYIQMASRHVLTTNHVVEIMLKWLEVRDWKKAFLEIIPQRKLKNELEGAKSGGGEEEGDEEEGDEDEDEGEKERTAESGPKEADVPQAVEEKEGLQVVEAKE